jgi:AraC-like DNA-binding protein
MFLLREDEIDKLMNSFDYSGGGYAYIADDDDYLFCNSRAQSDKHRDTFRLPELPENKLFGSEVSYDTKGQKILFTYISSARTGLHYVVAQPYKIVMKKVSYVKTLSFTIIVGAFLLGILISLYLSRRNAKSLKETLKILPKMDEKSEYYKDPFELIQESVYQIIKDNRMLNETIDRQISLLHSSFFQKLRNREFATEDELISYADFIGLNFNGKAFASSIVQIEQLGKVKLKFNDKAMKELDDGRLKVIHVLKEFAYTRNYYSDDKNDLIIIINILDNDNGDQYKQNMISYMQIVRNELMHKYEIDIRFSWGDICINPIDLSYSIQQEVWALDYANSNDIRYDIWYPEFIRSCQNVFFPKEWEDKLMEYSKCGNAEKVKKLIFELQLKNLKKCTMMPESSDLFVHKLYSISMQMVAELSMKRDDVVSLEKILGNRTLDNYIDAVEYITGVFISVCKEVGGNKGQQNSKQMNEICRYVDDNYMNSSLSLSVLAEKFNYSPAYLSLLFKQQTGNNFSCYLEKIRMEHSTRLLKDTDMSIAQISELVGYNSSNSFCRVFKKAFHLSPGQYRQTV